MTGQQQRTAPSRMAHPTSNASRPRMLLFWTVLAAPASGFATVTLNVSGDYQHQENSNIFDLAPGAPPVFHANDPKRGDAYDTYGGSLTSALLWSRQSLTLNIDGHDYRYQHFRDLDHQEYKLGADWDWKAGRLLEGSLGINRNRNMVPFYEFSGTQTSLPTNQSALSLQTDQSEHAKVTLRVTPDWRLETSASESKSDSPRPGLPNLSLREDTGQEAIKYTGTAGLTAGISAQYTRGTYSGADATIEPRYHQTGAQATASYSLNPDSALDFAAGYTRRRSASGIDNLSGGTGTLGYRRSLTAKTRVKLELSRVINSYITNTGSEIDSAALIEVNWEATRRISVSTRYTYTYSELPGQGLAGADRLDHFRIYQLGVDYKPFNWLEVQPYARWETRTSGLQTFEYSANIYGINAYLRWKNGAAL